MLITRGAAVLGILMCGAAPAGAQTASASTPKWTIEVFGGGAAASESAGGSPISAIPSGTPFTSESGRPTRQVPSWYFGDGARLLNQVLDQFDGIDGASRARMVPLDIALGRSGASRSGGAVFGLRLGRSITDRFAVDISVERSQAKLVLADSVSAALNASSDAFVAAFDGLLSTAPVTMLAVNSQVAPSDRSSQQTRVAGALRWTVARGRRVEAYLSGGGGVVFNTGDLPRAVLTGTYSFRLFGFFAMQESDRVVVELSQPKSAAMGTLGAGLTYSWSDRSGVRLDARLSLNRNSTALTVSGSPSVTTQASGDVLVSPTTPSIQFSPLAGIRSSLSGAPLTLTTFSGSGLSRHFSLSVGLFRRF